MVAVAAGRRAGAGGGGGGGVGGRRRAGQAQQNSPLQQKLLAVAVAARFAETGPPPSAEGSGAGGCCVELLDCLLGALNVSVATVTPAPAQYKRTMRSIRRRGEGSAEDRHADDAPSGRISGNGASASAAASLYTLQGRKGVNQDAMVVWEVQYIPSSAFLVSIQQIIPLFISFPHPSSRLLDLGSAPRSHLRDVELVSRML